ncbi:MAG: acylphosphatase [Acidobacteriia bacterium]|nr:acylphosphatase [Terriglobia bacterium]
MKPARSTRRYTVHGRVQGVGFRYFVELTAQDLGLSGYVRNRADGTVEVCAGGNLDRLERLKALLAEGPRWARVDRVEETEAPDSGGGGFHITY